MLSRLLGRVQSAAPPPTAHRPILKRDVERMRWCVDGSFVMPKDNPGVRLEPEFVTTDEAAAVAAELRAAADSYGYAYQGDTRAHVMSSGGDIEATLPSVVNNVRVTGRLEKPELGAAVLPPWGHGDGFDSSALPPAMRQLAAKVASCGAFRVGPPRDATINVRENSFFQLDPHVDPASDGTHARTCMHMACVHTWHACMPCHARPLPTRHACPPPPHQLPGPMTSNLTWVQCMPTRTACPHASPPPPSPPPPTPTRPTPTRPRAHISRMHSQGPHGTRAFTGPTWHA